MFIGKLITKSSTLNNIKQLGSIEFRNGEYLPISFILFDNETQQRYIPLVDSIVIVSLNLSDDTILTKSVSLNLDDRSICSFSLTKEETVKLLGGNITFTIDELGTGTQIREGIIRNALARIVD